ncbi:hypothetical protein [Nocardia arthritidis]|uniref:Uncharacterized protein n=1 Tax=Nocardia arthritidis TaxID=228602 RepID=A0A6G9YLA0_9NOCA|nr:hypothetical protein [Nocardia arthritidis]QIS13978.1 hypothetical protein F5544_30675 [Nocardia arthritidis]
MKRVGAAVATALATLALSSISTSVAHAAGQSEVHIQFDSADLGDYAFFEGKLKWDDNGGYSVDGHLLCDNRDHTTLRLEYGGETESWKKSEEIGCRGEEKNIVVSGKLAPNEKLELRLGSAMTEGGTQYTAGQKFDISPSGRSKTSVGFSVNRDGNVLKFNGELTWDGSGAYTVAGELSAKCWNTARQTVWLEYGGTSESWKHSSEVDCNSGSGRIEVSGKLAPGDKLELRLGNWLQLGGGTQTSERKQFDIFS